MSINVVPGSMWICIGMAPLDPDPYVEYGSGSRTVKMAIKKVKNRRFQIEKSSDLLKKT